MAFERDKLLYEVSKLYYEDKMTQEKVAKQMGLSRQRVQRFLDAARKEGIVQIHLVNPMSSCRKLEEKLEQHFKLTKAIVIPCGIKTEEIIRKNIGKAAAIYLEKSIHDNDIIGIGWGRTVYEIINYFNPNKKIPITAVPLIGGIGQMSADFQVNELVKKFAEKAGGTFIPFYVPALVDTDEIINVLFSDTNIGKVAKLWGKVNIAVIGIGGPLSKDSYIPTSYYNEADIDLLKKEESAGDILSYFLCQNGKLCTSQLSKKVMGISPELLRKIKRVVAVAGSLRKKDAIFSALEGKFIDVLVTDDNVAKSILKNKLYNFHNELY